jgi:DNA-binding HxlR family transcriptional regulator
MDVPTPLYGPTDCRGFSEILSRVGDKWTVQVLRDQPPRFNDIKRHVSGISQQMLTRTLKTLERDGMVERTVRATTSPRVEYALTALGRSLSEPVRQLTKCARAHLAAIHDNRCRYDTSR